ncbi:PAS domain S-box protein [Pontibacter sp. JH31]|uniref:histidine kinase n=1 Tax=Pontibacter aquaedesilientis TaxID=2766980 RepID=A0ABR7XBB4_9BACT|nr:PAS domain S-box protein [Pontibacter aquaedesilientis]MBD1395604.1 PAS domain S-box protein [Pontibacter aquaedesilientis]
MRTIHYVLLAFSGLLLTLLIIISYTFFQARDIQENQEAYVSRMLLDLELIDKLQDNENTIHKAILLHLTTSSDVDKQEYEFEIINTQAQNKKIIARLNKLFVDKGRLAILRRFEQETSVHDTLIVHLLELSRAGDRQAAISFNHNILTPEYRQHQNLLNQLSDNIHNATRQSGQKATGSVTHFVRIHRMLLGLALLVTIIAIVLVRSIIQRLRRDNALLNAQITGRQQLEKALLESQNQYKMLFDRNPMPMWVYDQHTLQFLQVNEAALKEYGYTRAEFLAKTIFHIRPEIDVPLLKYKLNKQDKLESQSSRARHMRKDGSVFDVEVKSHALSVSGPHVPRLVVAMNVDERQKMIEKLQKSEKQLLEISSSIPGAVFQLQMSSDTDYSFTFVSAGIEPLFQINPADLYADPSALYHHIKRSDTPKVQQALLNSYRTLEPLVVVFRIWQQHTENWKWVQAHGLPTLKGAGQVIWNGTMIDLTDQKVAQQQLVKSEANLRALLDSSPQAIYLLDQSLHIIMFNAVAKQDVRAMLLQDLQAGQNILHLVDKSMAGQLKANHAKVLQGQTVIYETGHGAFWHEIALRPVLDPQNNVLAVSLSILNISERKLAMETIKRNEEQLARAQHLAHLGNWELDFDREILTWSDSVYDIYGVSKMAFQPTLQNVLRFVPEQERELIVQAYKAAAKSREIFSFEHSIVRPDGSTRILIEIGEPEFDEAGKLTRFHGSVQDITDRKNTEQEVLRAKNLLQSTLENIPEVIFSADTNLNLIYVSPQSVELTGYAEEEFLGNPSLWLHTVHEQDRTYLQEQVIPKLLAGERQHCELRIWTRKQELKWFMLRISPKINESGQVYRLDGSASDMTQYKLAEEKRNELTDQLLKQNQNLQQFAYIVSHNLRAPIANILGLTTIYNKSKPDTPMNSRIIDNLFKSAKLLDATIRDLNDILTIRSELNKVREEVNFGEILEDVVGSLPEEVMDEHANIVTNFSEAPSVVAVRSYVHSIMHNLVTNAFKYKSPDRILQLQIKTSIIPNYICLSVSDNGLGINLHKEKDKVFGLYKRFHPHTEGRGLGLHLVKTQAELLGGKVEVDSKVGMGTTFSIYFRYNV